jgi:hypothetical protein
VSFALQKKGRSKSLLHRKQKEKMLQHGMRHIEATSTVSNINQES